MATYIVNLFSALLFLMSVNINFIKCGMNNNHHHHYEENILWNFCGSYEELRNQLQNISTGLILRSRLGYFVSVDNLDINCNLTIKAPNGYGLFATIQNMSIKKREGDTNGCQNYIRFVKKNQKKHHDLKTKHCGDYTYTNSAPVGIYDSDGEITIEIFMKALRTLDLYDKFVIVFTVVRMCEEDDAMNNLKNIPGSSICMKEEYICDKIHNCYGRICEDEGKSCEQNTESPVLALTKHETSNKGRNDEITDIIQLPIFVVIILCIFCYFYFSKSQVATRPQVGVSLELEENIVTNLPPSYYSLSFNQEPPKEEDPPSYESLSEAQTISNATSSHQ